MSVRAPSHRGMGAVVGLILGLAVAASWAAPEEPATECADVREAAQRGWGVIAGDAAKGHEPGCPWPRTRLV